MNNKISVVITTANESKVLRRCLDSVKNIAGEILVFDLSSIDDTQKIAEDFGAKIIIHPHADYVEKVRDISIKAAGSDWIFILDPDEVVSQGLAEKIKEFIKSENISAYNIPRKNIFWGRWVSHTNFWPDRQIRLFKKNKVTWPERIHTYPIIEGVVVDLPATASCSILHYGYDNFAEFFDRQNRYSSIEVENIGLAGTFSWPDMIWKSIRVWLVRYIKHLGFLDGYLGLFLVYNLMITQLSISVKLWERKRSG